MENINDTCMVVVLVETNAPKRLIGALPSVNFHIEIDNSFPWYFILFILGYGENRRKNALLNVDFFNDKILFFACTRTHTRIVILFNFIQSAWCVTDGAVFVIMKQIIRVTIKIIFISSFFLFVLSMARKLMYLYLESFVSFKCG